MAMEITKEQQRMIDLAIASGAFRTPDDVIGTALAMLFKEIEDGIVSEARRDEPRFTLDDVEAELGTPGKPK
jgi:Arc/MetJ-type ribon-helix-helix transcriptional regulator